MRHFITKYVYDLSYNVVVIDLAAPTQFMMNEGADQIDIEHWFD